MTPIKAASANVPRLSPSVLLLFCEGKLVSPVSLCNGITVGLSVAYEARPTDHPKVAVVESALLTISTGVISALSCDPRCIVRVEVDVGSGILKGDSPGMNRDAGKCVATVTARIACLDALT